MDIGNQVIIKKLNFYDLSWSNLTLVLSNLLPIFGILFFNWNIYIVLMVYFTETFIAGFFAMAKIALARKDYFPIPEASQVSMFDTQVDDAINFIPKYILVLKFLGWHILITLVASLFCLLVFTQNFSVLYTFLPSMLFPAIGFIISFSISFKKNYLDRKEFLYSSSRDIYRRHLLRFFLIFGSPFLAVSIIGWVAKILAHYNLVQLAEGIQNDIVYGKTTAIVLTLIVTCIDLYRHIREHMGIAELSDG